MPTANDRMPIILSCSHTFCSLCYENRCNSGNRSCLICNNTPLCDPILNEDIMEILNEVNYPKDNIIEDNEVIEKKRQDKENKELNDAFENKRKALLNYMVKLDQKSKKEYQEAEKKCDVLCKKLGI